MKKLIKVGMGTFVVAALVAGMAGAEGKMEHGGMNHGKNASWKTVSLEGEFVDLGCYVAHDARGWSHKSCALECATAGAPLALLEKGSGRLYMVVTPGHGQDPYGEAIKHLGSKVRVEGAVASKAGVDSLYVTSVPGKVGRK